MARLRMEQAAREAKALDAIYQAFMKWRAGLTQEALAKQAGTSVENGGNAPTEPSRLRSPRATTWTRATRSPSPARSG